jgi:hypothetical protein
MKPFNSRTTGHHHTRARSKLYAGICRNLVHHRNELCDWTTHRVLRQPDIQRLDPVHRTRSVDAATVEAEHQSHGTAFCLATSRRKYMAFRRSFAMAAAADPPQLSSCICIRKNRFGARTAKAAGTLTLDFDRPQLEFPPPKKSSCVRTPDASSDPSGLLCRLVVGTVIP